MAAINIELTPDQKIDLNELHVVDYWCRLFGCSPIDLRNAVLAQEAANSFRPPVQRDNFASSTAYSRGSRFGSP